MTRTRDVATQGGLVLLSATTIGSAVSSVIVSNAFNATYENYFIMVSNVAATVGPDNHAIQLRTGSTTATTGYYYVLPYHTYGGTASAAASSNTSSWASTGRGLGNGEKFGFSFHLYQPFLANKTTINSDGPIGTDLVSGGFGGYHNSATSYESFVMSGSGTYTGGTIKVYGYK